MILSKFHTLEEARIALLKQVRKWTKDNKNVSHENSGIIRLQVSVTQANPLEWLTLQDCNSKIYWENRNQKEQFAGIGVAHEIYDGKESYEKILIKVNELLKDSPDTVRFFGGMRFDQNASTSSEWEKWRTACLTLPLVELSIIHESVTLACHIFPKKDTTSKLKQLQNILESMRTEDMTIPDSPLIQLERHDIPGYKQWCRMVEEVLENIECGKIDKAVLARTAVFNLARNYDPTELLLQLRGQAPQAFHYCFQIESHHAFLGISPELLYRRSGREIESEAIAGTRPRGLTNEDDQRLASELCDSEKEKREHLMVLERIERLIQKFCKKTERLSYLDPLQLRHVQHLQSKIRGSLLPGISDKDLLPVFHPTPAVSGTPDPEALTLIRKLEPFDRGWYAGPVGWLSRSQAEFAVGIRSGLLCGRILRIYTGAGIVDGSVPDEEWREIEIKLQSWQYLLGRT